MNTIAENLHIIEQLFKPYNLLCFQDRGILLTCETGKLWVKVWHTLDNVRLLGDGESHAYAVLEPSECRIFLDTLNSGGKYLNNHITWEIVREETQVFISANTRDFAELFTIRYENLTPLIKALEFISKSEDECSTANG